MKLTFTKLRYEEQLGREKKTQENFVLDDKSDKFSSG